MPLKQWNHSDFATDEARALHKKRSMEHWRACFHAWFWLFGPGSLCQERTYVESGRRWVCDDEVRVARRECTRFGWEWSTLIAAHDFAVRNGPATSSPPSTIERDWPERWDIGAEQRREMYETAIGRKVQGPPKIADKPRQQREPTPVVEVLYDGQNLEQFAGMEAPC